MGDRHIPYSDRTFGEYQKSILAIMRDYYPDLFKTYDDAGVGRWIVDLVSDVADSLSYNIDRAYQETDVRSASMPESVRAIARTSGLSVPGPKCAVVEVEISCVVPVNNSVSSSVGSNIAEPDASYFPYVRRGTKFTSGGAVTFELCDDVDFSSQFDRNGMSDRQIYPNRDSNQSIVSYTVKKLAMAVAGMTKVFSKVVLPADVKPFMSIKIPDSDVVCVESIICKEGSANTGVPTISEFLSDEEEYYDRSGRSVQRYFEVGNLCEQHRFGCDVIRNDGSDVGNGCYYEPVWQESEFVSFENEDGSEAVDESGLPIRVPVRLVANGRWKRLKNKFTTEFGDDGSLTVTFGMGLRNYYGSVPEENASLFAQNVMARMEANDYMGVLPQSGCTVYVLYRVGGGEISNVAAGTVNEIIYRNVYVGGNCDDMQDDYKKAKVVQSLSVTNPAPSYGGKDTPSPEELRHLIKYNAASQNRCVTLHDYYARIAQMEPKFGVPFRHNVVEENNKVVIYALGLDSEGRLVDRLSEPVAENLKEYLKGYRCVSDFVEVRPGRVVNVAFDVNVFVDKSYNKDEVSARIVRVVSDYMDVRRHVLGEDVFLGDLEKEISKEEGVVNLVALRCYDMGGKDGYSATTARQPVISADDECEIRRRAVLKGRDDETEIDLVSSGKMLYSAVDTMFEVRYPSGRDIRVIVKQM